MCYPSLHIPLHQPNPREPPCAPSAYPTPGYSGDPLAAQRSTRPTQLSATPTRVRPRFRRAKSLLRVAICLDSHHLPPGPSCTDSYVLSPCWVPSSVVRILHGLLPCNPTRASRQWNWHHHRHLTEEQTDRGRAMLLPPFSRAGGGEARALRERIGAPVFPAVDSAQRIRFLCCRPPWDTKRLVHFQSISQY